MNVNDLRNMITMDLPLSVPVQTQAGLVKLGFLEAFEDDVLLTWTNHTTMLMASAIDQLWSQIAVILSGAAIQVVGFNADMIGSSSHYADDADINKVISPAEYTDLHYLANLCSRNQLTVTSPAALASASAPVLTLDKEGSPAVYVGRAGCGRYRVETTLYSDLLVTAKKRAWVFQSRHNCWNLVTHGDECSP